MNFDPVFYLSLALALRDCGNLVLREWNAYPVNYTTSEITIIIQQPTALHAAYASWI